MASTPMQSFRDFVKGVRFLHSHHWIHRDLKPSNVGIIGTRAVILDYRGALKLRPGELIPATPGRGGTVDYFAPECEMESYGLPVDVWAAGLIGFETFFGFHPWAMALNPWRAGSNHERERPLFHNHYNSAMQLIRSHKNSSQSESDLNRQSMLDLLIAYTVCDLFEKMLGHQWARGDEHRISIFDALEHPCWPSHVVEPSPKRLVRSADTADIRHLLDRAV